MLTYCYICLEPSIVKKVYIRKHDGAKCVYEFCLNKNPKCQYKNHRVLTLGVSHGPSIKEEIANDSPRQYELFPNFEFRGAPSVPEGMGLC